MENRLFSFFRHLFRKEKACHSPKCKECDITQLWQIQWHDGVFNKCITCDYIAVDTDQMIRLGYNIVIENNVANVKKNNKISSSAELAKLKNAMTLHRLGVKQLECSGFVCDKCHSELALFKNKYDFMYYYCSSCGTFYFRQKDYDNMVKSYVKK